MPEIEIKTHNGSVTRNPVPRYAPMTPNRINPKSRLTQSDGNTPRQI